MPHVNELHEQHDPMLVVSLASGDLATADRDYSTAQSLVAGCSDCARLHDDVLAIAAATKALPPAARTRDFQISPDQAARLRPSGVRGVLARLTAPGGLFSPQLGVGLATLGVAGLLIGSLGSINLGFMSAAGPASGGAAPAASITANAPEYATQASPAAASDNSYGGFAAGAGAAASAAPDELSPAGTPFSDTTRNVTDVGSTATGAPGPTKLPLPLAASQNRDADPALPANPSNVLTATSDSSVLVIVSSALLIAGVLMLLARRFARGGRSG